MTSNSNSTNGPQVAPTAYASDDEVVGDSWTGRTLGKYKIVRRLGRGGMGVVFEAFDPILQRSVAVKVLRDGIAAQPESARKFLREARTAAKLNHPHVVAVYDADVEKATVYLVMELMEGGSAHDRIRKWGPFGWVEATQVILDACKGLAAVHAAGFIHRDIKPSNVMRATDGSVKLADFGLAATTDSSGDQTTPMNSVVGTPLFMSPEQCKGLNVETRSDIYALGATYYTLLTGQPPFDGKNAMDIMYGHCSRPIPDPCLHDSNIPAACADLIRRMMAKEPDERPVDAALLTKELEAIKALATSPDIRPLDWAAPGSDQLAPTPIPGMENTVAATIEPVYLTNRRPRTRAWFVAICMVLMGVAYTLGRFLSQPAPPRIPKDETPVVMRDPANPDDAEAGLRIIDAGGPVTFIAFDPSDRTRIVFGNEHEEKIASWPDNRILGTVTRDTDHVSTVRQAAFWMLRETACFVTLYNDRLHFFDVQNYKPNGIDGQLDSLSGKRLLAFTLNPDSPVVARAYRDIRERDSEPERGGIVLNLVAKSGPKSIAYDVRLENNSPPTSIAFSAKGTWLMCGQGNGMVARLRVHSKNGEVSLTESGGIQLVRKPVSAIVAIDDSRFVAAVGNEIWMGDTAEGNKPQEQPLYDSDKPVTALAVSEQGKLVAWTNGDSIAVYDTATNKVVQEIKSRRGIVNALAFDKGGNWLATGGPDGKIVVWPLTIADGKNSH